MKNNSVLLGDFLVKQGMITQEQLETALKYQEKNDGKLLGMSMVELGFISENEIIKALSSQLGVHIVPLKNIHVPVETIHVVPESIAKTYNLLPIHQSEETLTVGMSNPLDLIAIDAVSKSTGLRVKPVVCRNDEISEALDYYYRSTRLDEHDNDIRFPTQEALEFLDDPSLLFNEDDKVYRSSDDVSVSHLVHLLLVQSVNENATYIHLEPSKNGLSIKYRINGHLKEFYNHADEIKDSIIATIKNLGYLDVNRCDLPQNGSFQLRVNDSDVYFQVSVVPTVFGESVVLKITRSNALITINDLEFSEFQNKIKSSLFDFKSGIIWITGQINSGKTSTLYAFLRTLNSSKTNIMTYEKEIFCPVDEFRQYQVNYHGESDSEKVLNAFFVHDADIIAVDGIHDSKIVDQLTRMAIKGKLIYATLPTSNVVKSICYLSRQGIDPYYVAEITRGIISQILVRKICENCKELYTPTESELKKIAGFKTVTQNKFYQGKGCSKCRNSGYSDRIAVFEMLAFDDGLRELIASNAPKIKIEKYLEKNNFSTLFDETVKKLAQGETTLDETFRVMQLL